MSNAKLKVIGCGDAFGTGGLHTTCFHLETKQANCLIDIGAGSLPNLKAMGIDLNDIDVILLSHFHGDHFGGLPNFLLDATFVQRRSKPLFIAGPAGVEDKVWQLQDVMYGDTSTMEFGFSVHFKEYASDQTLVIFPDLLIKVLPVIHCRSSNPHALKIRVNDKVIVYTGDTEWTDELIPFIEGCDILISECFGWEGPMKYHLSYLEIISKIEELSAKGIFLTHLGPDAYSRQFEMELTVLKPGMEIVI